MRVTADFETITDPDDCRVWAWGVFEIGVDNSFLYGNDIESFMTWIASQYYLTVYFHNLKFDGEFILNWLFRNNFKHTTDKLEYDKTFSTLISDKGMFYCMEIMFEGGRKVKILDSLKVLPMSVEAIAKGFGLEIRKGSIDYDEFRSVGHQLTEEEIAYLRNDVEIVAQALKTLFEQNLKKMTQGSNALADYKKIVGKKVFQKWYPIPPYDKEVRQSYKGGFVYVKPEWKEKDVGEGIVLDVNSLYPSVMYYEKLPYGEGVSFSGKYEKDAAYPLFVQMLKCEFELKEGYLPTIQLKNNLGFNPTEYCTSSDGQEISLCLTNVDLKLFLEHYRVYNVEWGGGWKFHAGSGMFTAYIDKWYKVKEESTKTGNKPMRQLAKLMLNALYGKFALNPNVQSKIPFLENGVVRYRLGEKEERDPIYIPMGTFITAYARNKTIRSAQKVYDRFIYADTDSLHLIGSELPEGLDVDPTRLGAWAHESTFTRARFVRAKTYVEEIDGELNITCAGMPKTCYSQVTWENFHCGAVYTGKLVPRHVQGGICLLPTTFKIKEDK